jgi:REP element-mobilizing transposase RayT
MDIFKSQRDREKFLGYLQSATERYCAVIHAYCLMSNHYHLILETPQGNLSQIMKHINSAYTTYYNIKRKRVGHLLQGERGRVRLLRFEDGAQPGERAIRGQTPN